jgi:hypothetical protein
VTGKARIDGLSRIQLVWATLAKSSAPVSARELRDALAIDMSMHQLDHVLSLLYKARHIARHRVPQDRWYRYRAIGKLPRDRRDRADRRSLRRSTPNIKAPLDDPVIRADNRKRGEVASEKPPPIPSLVDLLART